MRLVFRYRCWTSGLSSQGLRFQLLGDAPGFFMVQEKDSLLFAVASFTLPSSMSGTFTLEDIAALFLKAR